MTKMKALMIAGCIAVLAAIAIYLLRVERLVDAPDFTLPNQHGESVSLSEQRGKVVLINFWASWCAPCRQEMPKMEAMYNKYEPEQFEILAVNIGDQADRAIKLASELGLSFPVLFDTNGEVGRRYNIQSMPTTIIVDQEGKQRLVNLGYRPGDEQKYEELIEYLINQA